MNYKRRLKGLRIIKGLTQNEMAQLLDMPKSTYIKKENGKSSFSIEEAIGLSRVLELSIDNIFLNN